MFRRRAFQAFRAIKTETRLYSTNSVENKRSSGSRAITLGVGSLAIIGGVTYWYWPEAIDTVMAKEPNPAFTNQGFFNLKLDSVENINHNTKKFRFALPEENQVSGLQTASCLLTRYQGPDMEKAVIRPYTPTSDEDEIGYLDLLVKKYPTGIMSSHFHELTPGQTLEFKGPIVKYPWNANKHNHIALIAGGTGIAPMYQLIRAIFKNPNDKTKVTLVFGNITEEDILLRKELQELENTYPQRFRAFYVLDNPPKSWSGEKGYISKNLLKTVLPEPKEENIKIFVCGPPPMYKAISGAKVSASDQGELDGSILEQLGYSKDQVFKF
ncbi:hypothetical protein EPUL_000561 [Erysiphe pulchra]|uniref:NADH-cytochrome b5 reductase n=1 Tax=Erysiphe pulchra TaxID=225359 RepID=A0A2S4Q1A2_9PEZI|nr:hypothetical protein EPUL_000561 [Erysiphe pulchra]